MRFRGDIRLSTVALLVACWPALTVRSAETRHLAGVEHVSTINLPHRWGVDFVKRGNYLYLTGSESQRKFAVIDASDPRNLKVVAENEAGLYAARNLCIHDNLILTNLYRYINAIDVSDPTQPELLLGCQWDVDPERQGPLPHYRFQWVGKHVFLACAKPQRAFRVYEVERLFLPKLVATVDLSSRLDEACVKVLSAAQQWYPNAEMLVDGATVHTSFGTHVVGFDVRNPAAPSVLYCHKMPANVVGLALAGKRLYVAMNSRWTKKGDPGQDASVAVVDLASPASLKILGEYRGMAVPERLLIAGDTLYLVGEEKMPPEAANLGGVPFTRGLKETFERRVALHVLDAANPARIVCRASLPFPLRVGHYGDAVCRAMALDGGVLFVADHDYGVRTVDVSDPGRPRLIGGLRTITHEVRKVIPAGKTLYIVNGSCVNAADISDPQRPLLDVEGSLSAIAGWTISQPVFHPNGRFLYSLKRGSYEVAVAEFQKRGAARGEVVNLVRLPDGWGGRDLGWARDRLFVLGTKENEWAKAELFVFQPVDGGKGLKLTARCPLGAFKSWVGWVWGTAFLVADDRVFVLNCHRKASEAREGRYATQRQETVSTDLAVVDVGKPDSPRAFPPVNLVELTPGLRPTFFADHALAYKDGYLFFYALDDSPPKSLPSYLLVYDVRNPEKPSLVAALKEPAAAKDSFVVRNLCLLSPEPYLAGSSEANGAWVVDIRDPRQPVTAWKEPEHARATDTEHYDMIAKPCPGYQVEATRREDSHRDGYLYVPRLDRVDVFRLDFRDGPPPTAEQRASRVRAAAKATATSARLQAALSVQARQIGFHLDRGELQQAEELGREVEAWLAKPAQPLASARRAAAMNVDGKPDEWAAIPWTPFGRGPAQAKWQWDDRNLYILLAVTDPALERSPGLMRTPHCYTGDHVDLFLTLLPASADRPYGPADTHVSVDLSGNVELHYQNPRIRGDEPSHRSRRSKLSAASVASTPNGYLMELALSHEDTWLNATPGALIACSIVVTDHGERQMLLRPSRVLGYQAVQPTWPRIELSP